MALILPPKMQIKGGGLITFKTNPGQAVFWYLVGINHLTGQEEAAHGTLKWAYTKADKTGHAVNLYYAPTSGADHIDRVDAKFATGG